MPDWTDDRIVRVEELELSTRYPRRVGRNARLSHHGTGPTVRATVLHAESGAVGWGLAAGPVGGLSALTGRALREIFDPDRGVIDPMARPADFALHDLAGQILDQPVYRLLGGRGQPSVEVYDGAIYFDDLDPDDAPRGVDAIVAECAADHEVGYDAFKLKIGRGSLWMDPAAGGRRDIEVTRAVRAAYPEARILVDANDGYSVEGLIAYLEAVCDCSLYWVEEPFAENAADLRVLRDHLSTLSSPPLVADGEFEPDLDLVLSLAEDALIDVALMDISSFGLSSWRAVMPRLERLGVRGSPHAWGQPLKTLYAAHAAVGLGNVEVVEGVPGATIGVDTSGYALQGGVLRVPDAPGFGIPVPAR